MGAPRAVCPCRALLGASGPGRPERLPASGDAWSTADHTGVCVSVSVWVCVYVCAHVCLFLPPTVMMVARSPGGPGCRRRWWAVWALGVLPAPPALLRPVFTSSAVAVPPSSLLPLLHPRSVWPLPLPASNLLPAAPALETLSTWSCVWRYQNLVPLLKF